MKTPRSKQPRRCKRMRPSPALKAWLRAAQSDRCLGCDSLLDGAVEFDHVIPLALGGANRAENWAALCKRCHRTKTAADLKRIAKAKRQRRYHETGRSRAPSQGWAAASHFRASRQFSKTLRRHMNGMVTPRCACAKCRPQK